ncbi:hypothetical protein T02_14803 [Trichinella nativa]|nr:hypothetical protein T02_11924 [Trichinella nativa]KRZ58500.1 hypothetical protein T02_14803 [Trichinella nativa]
MVIDHSTFVFIANRSSSLNKADFHCLVLRCYTFADERRSYCGSTNSQVTQLCHQHSCRLSPVIHLEKNSVNPGYYLLERQ